MSDSTRSISNGARKILFITDAWHPQVNGVVRVLDALIPRLKARGIEVEVIEPGQFKTIPLPFYPEIRLSFFSKRKIAKALDELGEEGVVCLMTEGPLGWSARKQCRARGIPFTSWYHSHFQLYVDARLHGLLKPVFAFIRRFHSGAVRTIASNETLRQELLRGGFQNVVIVPLGVDTELFKRNLAPKLPELPQPVFAYFSRIASEKSPEEFLKLDLPGTKLVIGDGPLRQKLEKKYGATNRFVGYKRGQELVDWLSLVDVFVFPSRTETFGLVALEALACSIPVAAHNVMGPQDIITEGKDGYLGEGLRECALKCLELSRDDCRAKALQYSWDHSTDEFLKQFEMK